MGLIRAGKRFILNHLFPTQIGNVADAEKDDEVVTKRQLDREIDNIDLSAYATKDSPALTGTPTAPTATPGTNTTQIATTAFVTAAAGSNIGNTDLTLTANRSLDGNANTYLLDIKDMKEVFIRTNIQTVLSGNGQLSLSHNQVVSIGKTTTFAAYNFICADSSSNFLLEIRNNGSVAIGQVSASSGTRLKVCGSGTSSTTQAFAVHNSSGTSNAFIVRDDGAIGIGGLPTSTSKLNIQGLPTSSAGLVSGDVWNDGGTLKIV